VIGNDNSSSSADGVVEGKSAALRGTGDAIACSEHLLTCPPPTTTCPAHGVTHHNVSDTPRDVSNSAYHPVFFNEHSGSAVRDIDYVRGSGN
jgi:hypothetical protein